MISLNLQKPEKQTNDRTDIWVQNIWETIQGEGPYAGRRAVFIRFTGCNLQCPMCDTDYTSKRNSFDQVELAANITNVYKHHFSGATKPLIVITGGEPFRQNFGELARELLAKKWTVQIETNGTLWHDDIPKIPLVIVCSPKTSVIHESMRPYIHAFKYVLQAGFIDDNDGLPISVLGNNVRPARPYPRAAFDHREIPIYVQPLDEQDRERNAMNMEITKQVAMKHGYILCDQMHKRFGLE